MRFEKPSILSSQVLQETFSSNEAFQKKSKTRASKSSQASGPDAKARGSRVQSGKCKPNALDKCEEPHSKVILRNRFGHTQYIPHVTQGEAPNAIL